MYLFLECVPYLLSFVEIVMQALQCSPLELVLELKKDVYGTCVCKHILVARICNKIIERCWDGRAKTPHYLFKLGVRMTVCKQDRAYTSSPTCTSIFKCTTPYRHLFFLCIKIRLWWFWCYKASGLVQ